eukprot:CAMPEP_0196140762 /NCGR_PEP_ID=MMETSP0910-20130528/7551_1 /TAXON_ID=49265 /ORGANISM="Thalassiosira rotula, Strain GSO102" /LENGTH=584 /DNA_ID=CAMNT_0041401665 /DNA_START=18 /DNA_END=1772 /DNA_ORIENTATION=-
MQQGEMADTFQPLANNSLELEPPRSIDDYIESAYRHNSTLRHKGYLLDIIQHWRYYIIFLALGIANSGDSAEMGCTSFILSSVKFQHDILLKDGEADGDDADEIDFAGRGAAVAGAHFAGMLISGLLSGVLADVWGRRSTLLLGLVCNAIVGVLSVGARNAAELCMLRFVLGVGLGMVIAGVVTLCAEVSPPSKRGRFMTFVGSCYTLGFMYTACWALVIFPRSGSGNWRLFMFMNALPTMVAASLVMIFVPESPRYFLCRGKTKEAVHVANVIATRIGYVDKLLTEEELGQHLFQARIGEAKYHDLDANESYGTVETPPAIIQENLLREVWMSLVSIKQVFANGMYSTTIPLQLSFFSLTLATGVAQWFTRIFQMLELPTDAYVLSFCNTLAQIPGMMLASGLIETGRRRLVMIGFGGGAAILILLSTIANKIQNPEKETTVDDSEGLNSLIVLGLACSYSIFLCMAWLSLDVLSAESFPTKVRSTGRGVCVATGRMGGFCVQFLYGPLINEGRLTYMFGIASLFAIGGLVMSCQTTDTTHVDLRDHWDYSKVDSAVNGENGSHDRQRRKTSLAETKRKLSID